MARVPPRFLYSGIRVREMSRSLRFYRKLGFRLHRRGTMEHGGKWAHLTLPGFAHRIELNWYPRTNRFYEPYREGTQFDHFGFYVADVEAWKRHLARQRIPTVAEFPDGKSRILYVRDPDGIWIEYFGPASRPMPRRRRRG